MIILQIFIFFFAIFMIYVVFLHKKRGTITPFELGIWITLWASFIFLTFFPRVLQGIAHTLYLSRVFDLLVIVALMILTALIVDTRMSLMKLKRKLEDYVRGDAIRDSQKK